MNEQPSIVKSVLLAPQTISKAASRARDHQGENAERSRNQSVLPNELSQWNNRSVYDKSVKFEDEFGIPLNSEKMPNSMVLLGNGAYGFVYKCVSKITGRESAVKVVQIDQYTKEEYEKTTHEILLYQQCVHNSIVQCTNFFENHQKTKIFMILELCNKGSLNKDISKRKSLMKPYSEQELKSICVDVLQGLDYLHQSNRCHLDLKPDNIGIKEEDFKTCYKLLDLGLSMEVGEFGDLRIGTDHYMAPEVYFGAKGNQENNTKVDMFSFGCVLYEVIFFDILYYNLTQNQMLIEREQMNRCFFNQICKGVPIPPHDYPDIFTLILTSCLKKNPDERLSAKQLLNLLGENSQQVLRVVETKLTVPQKVKPQFLERLQQIPDINQLVPSLKKLIQSAAESQRKVDIINKRDYTGADNPWSNIATGDSFYSGQTNQTTGDRQGFGVLYDRPTKQLYFGFFDKHKKNGFGIMIISKSTPVQFFADSVPNYYVGEYNDDKMNSFSALIVFREHQQKFCGRIEDNVIVSQGILTYFKNNHFHKFWSNFSNGEQDEFCRLLTRSSSSYECQYQGTFKGQQITKGTMVDTRQRTFEGDVWTSLTDGCGTIVDKVHGTNYTGAWKGLKMYGPGRLTKKDEFTYEGEFLAGLYEGKGLLNDHKNHKVTEAEFRQGLPCGKGKTRKYFPGSTNLEWSYEGDYEDGQFHGTGNLVNNSKHWVYEGLFAYNLSCGKGKKTFLIHPTLISFEGEFNEGSEMNGTLKYKNSDSYIGEVRPANTSNTEIYQLIKHGKGKMHFNLDSSYYRYDGEWQDDRFSGPGQLDEKDGSSYKGEFKAGLKEGKGEYIKISNGQASQLKGTFKGDLLVHGLIDYPDGAQYLGELNHKQQKSGKGSLRFKNGDLYNGQFENDLPHGKGFMNYSDPADHVYHGDFVKGKQEGSGRLYTDFIEYVGSFRRNRREGKGVIYFKDSNDFMVYEGEVKDNWIHGKGVLTFKDGLQLNTSFLSLNIDKLAYHPKYKYPGHLLREDLNFAFATITKPGSKPSELLLKYEGPIKNGYMHWRGPKLPVDGKIPKLRDFEKKYSYEGEFVAGKPDGQGTLKYDDGRKYTGWMKGGAMEEGKLTCTNGDCYEGPFVDDLPSGTGKIEYKKDPVLLRYSGAFLQGKPHGSGEAWLKDGRKFSGLFSEGTQKGPGKMEHLAKDANTLLVGDFEKFQLNGQGELFDFKTGNYYTGSFSNSKMQTKPDGEPGTLYFSNIDPSTQKPLQSTDSRLRYYRGEFQNNKLTGTGILHYSSRFEYSGSMVDGLRSGKGELKDRGTGDVYKGNWEKGKLVGNGLLVYGYDPERIVYVGQFESVVKGEGEACGGLPRPAGVGRIKYKDGSEYIGEIYRGMREGIGKLLSAEIVLYEGVFKADQASR